MLVEAYAEAERLEKTGWELVPGLVAAAAAVAGRVMPLVAGAHPAANAARRCSRRCSRPTAESLLVRSHHHRFPVRCSSMLQLGYKLSEYKDGGHTGPSQFSKPESRSGDERCGKILVTHMRLRQVRPSTQASCLDRYLGPYSSKLQIGFKDAKQVGTTRTSLGKKPQRLLATGPHAEGCGAHRRARAAIAATSKSSTLLNWRLV